MKLYFDHLVHFINRSQQEVLAEMSAIGLHAVIGGKHENWGTRNSLMYAGLSYIEFLTIEDMSVAENTENPLIQLLVRDRAEEGFGTVCLRTEDIVGLQESIQAKGYETSNIIEAQRRRENGDLLTWKMLFIDKDGPMPAPFFIQWEGTDDERLSDLLKKGIINDKQANKKISEVYFGVKDRDKAAAYWARLAEAEAVDEINLPQWNSIAKSIVVGDTKLIFAEPLGEGSVQTMLTNRGNRPFAVSISGNKEANALTIFGGMYRLT